MRVEQPSLSPMLVTVQDAGRLLGFSRSRIYEAIKQGEVVAVKAGRRTLLTIESIRGLVDGLQRVQ
ncbi:helix-turn-helix domain-containing protein [Acidocella facilis]|uniref:helix-turn-helix domain-containing protein n=1 Tax=Acidocella facilis TaxID=525 RepID=UPI0038D0D48A